VLSDDHVERIHRSALTLLSDTGMRVLDAGTRQRLISAGCAAAGELVRFDPELVAAALASAPSEFTLRARDPQHDLTLGGRHVVFGSIGGPAFVSDAERGRRPGTLAELAEYTALVQALGVIHHEGGGAFEPMDLPPETRHLDVCHLLIRQLDKNWQGNLLGGDRAADCLAMAAMALGVDRDDLAAAPALLGVINTNTPLTLDVPMAEGLTEFALAGQPVCVTPFTLAGAMAPVTLAGALALQHAEALAGITLTQVVRAGAPVVYGSFTSNVDLRSGSPAFGTPEYTKAAQASGQLARHCGLPFRSSNTTASNTVDAQAAYESVMSLWGAVMGGANLVNHGAGWLEGGLTASFEKLIVDAELLQMIAAYLDPIEVDDSTLALDAIAEVGHGGHFFGSAHTLARYEHAFNTPLVSDWRNYEAWVEGGALDTTERAHRLWRRVLAEHEPPALDPAVDAVLAEYVARRKAGHPVERSC
jgi:trimethylamine--corrinoid protein Co-methyltransferase